jgi:hypothetical protein
MPSSAKKIVVSEPRPTAKKASASAKKAPPSRNEYVGAALKRAHKAYAKKFGAQK